MKKICLPNLAAKDAARARRDVIVSVHVNDVKMLDSAPISVSARMKEMAAKVGTDAIWAFLSRKTNSVWRRTSSRLAYLLELRLVRIRARRENDSSLRPFPLRSFADTSHSKISAALHSCINHSLGSMSQLSTNVGFQKHSSNYLHQHLLCHCSAAGIPSRTRTKRSPRHSILSALCSGLV